MAKQKEAWDKLSMLEKALLIKLSVDNGVSSLKLIRDTYNLYANGGNLVHKKSGEEYSNENYADMKPDDTTTEINNNITLAQLAADYMHSYYNSDGFKARRKQYNWQKGEPRSIIRRRMDRTTIPINYTPEGGYNSNYDFRRNEINVGLNPKPSMAGLELYTIPVAETAAHEVTHAYDYPKTNIYGEDVAYDDSYKERGYYSSIPSELYNKYFTNLPGWTDSYRRQSDELYADLGGLRAVMYLATGYDSRLVDEKGNPIPITDEQWEAFKQTDYYKNNRFIKVHGDERSRSALLEIAQNNPSSSFLRLDGTYLAALGGLLDNKKSTGGPLYPFSFEKNPFLKTPVVRYDEGGHLFGFGDWLLNLFNTNKSLQLKLLVEDQTWQSLPDTIITTPKTNLNADISSIANTVTPGIHTDMLTTRGGFNTFNKFNIGDNDIYAVDKENKLFIPLDKKLYIDNMRPRLDYIGGDKDLTRKQAIEVFGLWPSIVDVANLYLLSPDLLARRLSKEGFLDTYTDRYNQYSNKELQKTMQNNPQLFWDSEVNSYNDFGLDTVLLDYIDGNISILDLNVKEFYDDLIKNNKYTQGSNEKGDATLNFNGSVLQLFHLQAAYFKYLESIYNARRKLGLYENIDLDTFLNAAYNLGIYNDDLQNAEWVNKNYKVPSWYTK